MEPHGDAQVFCRYIVAVVPLAFEPLSLLREDLRRALHGGSHQVIGLLNSLSRFINQKTGNFESGELLIRYKGRSVWGCSSAGRAPRSQRGGQRFDPAQLHQISFQSSKLTAAPIHAR